MAYIGKEPAPVALTTSDIADGVITEAKMADDAISLAELKAGTDGNVISYDASGNPVAIATGSDGQILTSAGAGQPPAFETASGGGITQASQWRMTADRSNSGADDDIDANLEEVDTEFSRIGSVMSESSGVFTFPATGIWLVTFNGTGSQSGADDGDCYIKFTPDNSTYTTRVTQWVNPGDAADKYFIYCQGMFDVTNTTNCKVKFGTGDTNTLEGTLYGDTNANETYFTFIRLGDT